MQKTCDIECEWCNLYFVRWEFDGKEDNMSKSIPYQLQKLFLLLQVLVNSLIANQRQINIVDKRCKFAT